MLPVSPEEFNSKTIKSKHEFKTFGLSRNETKEFGDEFVTSKVSTRRDGDIWYRFQLSFPWPTWEEAIRKVGSQWPHAACRISATVTCGSRAARNNGKGALTTTVVAWTTEPYRKTKASRADLEPRLNVSEADSSLHMPRWGDSTREHRSKWRCVSLSLINRYEEGDLENFPSSGAILKIKKNSWGCMWEIHRVF